MANVNATFRLTGTINELFSALAAFTAGGAGSSSPGIPLSVSQGISLANGLLADQVDTIYANTLTFTTGTPQALDLTTLLGPAGETANFKRVDLFLVVLHATVDGQLLKIGYSTTIANTWTALLTNPGQITLQAATAGNPAMFLVVAPNTTGLVVDSTHRLLNFDPGTFTGTVTADVILLGRSA